MGEGTSCHLARPVTAEDFWLPEFSAQVTQPFFDRVIELTDRLVVVTFRGSAGRCRLFETEEHLQCLRPERNERQPQGTVAMGERTRMTLQQLRRLQLRLPS